MLDSNYIYHIESIYSKVRGLLNDFSAFDPKVTQSEQGKKLEEKLKKIYNKLAFTKLTSQKQLLTITGLQGSGKTTILNRLYELEPGFLPENDGRGEQLPVIITEKEHVTIPECYLTKLEYINNEYKIIETPLNKEECYQTALHPKNNHFWIEVHVPHRFLKSDSKSIALLPGFEKEADQISQQLLDHILYMSSSSLIVFRKDVYARQTNATMISKIKRIFKDVQPIYVLTHGDVNRDENETIKNQVMKDFEVESERIIVSGDPSYYEEPWMEQLVRAINHYGYVTNDIESKKFEVLEHLSDEIFNVMEELKEELEKYEEQLISKSLVNTSAEQKLLNDFRKTYEAHLKDVKTTIINSLSSRTTYAKKHFEQYVDENINMLNNIKSFFVSNELSESIKYENKLEELWESADALSPTEQIFEVLTNQMDELENKIVQTAQREKLFQPNQLMLETHQRADNNLPVDMPYQHGELSEAVTTSLDNINRFFSANQETELTTLRKQDLQSLVLIGSMLGRQSFASSELLEAAGEVENSRLQVQEMNREKLELHIRKAENDFENLHKNIELTSKKTRAILTGIPLILGVDAAIDGEMDILINATAALSEVGIAISPAALLGIIGVALVGVKAVDIIHRQALQNNERKIQMALAGRKIINDLPTLQAESFCHVLRSIYEKMEDRIREQHDWKRNELGYDQDLMKLQYQANSIMRSNKQLIQEVMKHEPVALSV